MDSWFALLSAVDFISVLRTQYRCTQCAIHLQFPVHVSYSSFAIPVRSVYIRDVRNTFA